MELADSDTGRSMLRFLALAAGEGAEEVVSDLLSPLAEATYRDESLAELYRQLEPEDLLYSFMQKRIVQNVCVSEESSKTSRV